MYFLFWNNCSILFLPDSAPPQTPTMYLTEY